MNKENCALKLVDEITYNLSRTVNFATIIRKDPIIAFGHIFGVSVRLDPSFCIPHTKWPIAPLCPVS